MKAALDAPPRWPAVLTGLEKGCCFVLKDPGDDDEALMSRTAL
jgi:hypothetical protein